MSDSTGFGVTQQGFVLPMLTDLQTDINQALQALLGADINTKPQAIFGQLSGIMSERFYLLWAAMQDVYFSQVPDTSFGASLDNVGAIRGIPRAPATASAITNVKLFGLAGTLINVGTQFSVQGAPSSVFGTTSVATLIAGQSCIQTVTFSAAPASGTWNLVINGQATSVLAYNVSASTLQSAIRVLPFCSGCTVVQNSSTMYTITFVGAGTGGFMVQPQFTTTAVSLEDGSSNPVAVGTAITVAGIDQASVNVLATQTGPIVANAGTLINIVTPVAGLTNVLNIVDAVVGTNVETDNAYRTRMNQELEIVGAGTVEAIRSRLLQTLGVVSALVFENTEDIPDLEGRPPHSFEAVVNGGTDADIAETIWLAKPAGIATFGSSSYTITDSQGQPHVIYFSRPTVINIYLIVNLEVNGTYPANGNLVIQDILDTYVNGLGQGVNVILDPYMLAQLAQVPGIDYAQILAGTAPSPTLSLNIPIEPFQEAQTQTTFIIVNSVPG